QYAGSNAAGIVPSRQPARVEGGGMPATALAARRTPHIPTAKVRFLPRRPARSNRRKKPIPAKIARGIIRYSVCRYGIRTRGAAGRSPRPLPQAEAASDEAEPAKENKARRKQGEQRPPRLDVHIGQD